jgi:hypothetical protein
MDTKVTDAKKVGRKPKHGVAMTGVERQLAYVQRMAEQGVFKTTYLMRAETKAAIEAEAAEKGMTGGQVVDMLATKLKRP